MTVINSMIFDENSGCMVADENYFSSNLIYSGINKIKVFNNSNSNLLLGLTGNVQVLLNVIKEYEEFAEKNNFDFNLFDEVVNNVKTDFYNKICYKNIGFSYDELKNGHTNTSRINPDLIEKFENLISSNGRSEGFSGLFNNSFSILYKEKDSPVELYAYDFLLSKKIVLPVNFYSIDGSNYSDIYLSNFMENNRNGFSLYDGLSELIFATYKGAKIISGESLLNIKLLCDNKIYSPSANLSLLATELVLADKEKFFKKGLRDSLLKEIIFGESPDYKDLRKEMFRNSKKKNDLSLFLSGYRA